MGKRSDKERIVALQKALKVARDALQRLAPYEPAALLALDEVNRLDWMTNPPPLQGLCGHGTRRH